MVNSDDVKAIKSAVRTRCGGCFVTQPPTADQITDIEDLAVDLYRAADHHGIDRRTANAVTSFVSAAIDAVRARDRARIKEATQ